MHTLPVRLPEKLEYNLRNYLAIYMARHRIYAYVWTVTHMRSMFDRFFQWIFHFITAYTTDIDRTFVKFWEYKNDQNSL